MITTVTLNPMLDKTIYLKDFKIGNIWRSEKIENVPGGKGINVSRQLKYLGIDSIATGFLGGDVGNTIKFLLDQENIDNDFVFLNDTTRIGFTVLDESSMLQTSVFEPNPKVPDEKQKILQEKCLDYAKLSEWMVFSGSVPEISCNNFYKTTINETSKFNPDIKIILDSYGMEFLNGLCSKPFLVKPNRAEYENTFNTTLNTESDYLIALNNLLDYGVKLPIITNGSETIYFSFDEHYYKAYPPKVKVINPIGSGDSMIAAIVFGFINDWDIQNIMKFAISCGSANTSVWEIARCNKNDIESLMSNVSVKKF